MRGIYMKRNVEKVWGARYLLKNMVTCFTLMKMRCKKCVWFNYFVALTL